MICGGFKSVSRLSPRIPALRKRSQCPDMYRAPFGDLYALSLEERLAGLPFKLG